MSVVQFADKTEVNFDLNSHKAKNNTLNAIDNLRHKGGRRLNVGAALQFVRHSVFTSSTGSRRLEGVPQILILLTSKPSTDNVRGPAFALKEHEIVSVGIGVGSANLSELEMIAFKPEFTYTVTDFSKLRSIQSQLVASLNMNKDTEGTLNGISDLVGKIQRVQYFITFSQNVLLSLVLLCIEQLRNVLAQFCCMTLMNTFARKSILLKHKLFCTYIRFSIM